MNKEELKDKLYKMSSNTNGEQLLFLGDAIRVAEEALAGQKESIIKKIEGMKYTGEQIKDIGKSWIGHPCQGYNQALEDIKNLIQ